MSACPIGAMFNGMYAADYWRRPAKEKRMNKRGQYGKYRVEKADGTTEILTDEQVENWRRITIGMFGPYALLMTREQIQNFRDNMQKQLWEAI